jgi:hypothetical protein
MKNLRLIFVGTLVALCFAAQPASAATAIYDIALKPLTASTYRVHSNGTLTVTATATNKGPGTGDVFIVPTAQSGLSVGPGAICTVSGSSGGGDGPFCEFGGIVPGQSVSSTLTLTADPTSGPGDAWFVVCVINAGFQIDPIARNDCAMVTIRVLP